MTHRHILLLDGQRFQMTEIPPDPDCAAYYCDGVQIIIQRFDGPVPEAKYEQVFHWFKAVADQIPQDTPLHVLDPQHVLTT